MIGKILRHASVALRELVERTIRSDAFATPCRVVKSSIRPFVVFSAFVTIRIRFWVNSEGVSASSMSRPLGISSNSFTGYFSKTQLPPKIRCQTGRDSSRRKSSSQTKPKTFDGCFGWYCLNSENLTLNASPTQRVTRQNDGRADPMPPYLQAQTLTRFATVQISREKSSDRFGKQPFRFWCPSGAHSSRRAWYMRSRGLAD